MKLSSDWWWSPGLPRVTPENEGFLGGGQIFWLMTSNASPLGRKPRVCMSPPRNAVGDAHCRLFQGGSTTHQSAWQAQSSSSSFRHLWSFALMLIFCLHCRLYSVDYTALSETVNGMATLWRKWNILSMSIVKLNGYQKLSIKNLLLSINSILNITTWFRIYKQCHMEQNKCDSLKKMTIFIPYVRV